MSISELEEPEIVIEGGATIESQVREQIRQCILSGRLLPGEQLPTIRALAVGLEVAPAVVRNAYRGLTEDGCVREENGSGFFVASPARSARNFLSDLQQLCRKFLDDAAELQATPEQIVSTIESLLLERMKS